MPRTAICALRHTVLMLLFLCGGCEPSTPADTETKSHLANRSVDEQRPRAPTSNEQRRDWIALLDAIKYYCANGWKEFVDYYDFKVVKGKDVPLFLVGPIDSKEPISAFEDVIVCNAEELLTDILMLIPELNRPAMTIVINSLRQSASGDLVVVFSEAQIVSKGGILSVVHPGHWIRAKVVIAGAASRLEHLGTSGS